MHNNEILMTNLHNNTDTFNMHRRSMSLLLSWRITLGRFILKSSGHSNQNKARKAKTKARLLRPVSLNESDSRLTHLY